jgi:hypothetical protein
MEIRTRDLPPCSVVPQQATVPHVPWSTINLTLTHPGFSTGLHCENSATNGMSSKRISKIYQHNFLLSSNDYSSYI